MALPFSRNTTYDAQSQLLSADLNAMQDWIVKLYRLADAEWRNWLPVHPKTTSPNVTGGYALDAMAFVEAGAGSYALAIDTNGAVMISYDGHGWKQLGNTGCRIGLHQTNKYFFVSNLALGFIVGDDGAGAGTKLATSSDGNTWTARTDPAASAIHRAFAESGSIIVCARSAGGFITSPTGATWTERTHPATNKDIWGVAWSPQLSLFCAVNAVGNKLTSPDGITWTDRGNPNVANSHTDVIWSATRAQFIALDQGGKRVERSADGITWISQAANTIPTIGAVTQLIESGGILYAFDGSRWGGSNGLTELARSVDGGVTWEVQTFTTLVNAAPTYRGAAAGNGRLWIFGKNESTQPLVLVGQRR